MKKFYLLIALTLSVAGCLPTDQPVAEPDVTTSSESADAIYTNGTIYTVDDSNVWVEAVAIKDGKFVAVGSAADVEALAGDGTEVIDLGGRFVMPGLIDPHTHMFEDYHNQNFAFGIVDNSSLKTILAAVKAYAEENPDEEWIIGSNYPNGLFPGDSPTREMLDEIVPDRPICIADQSAHAWWCNTRALEIGGIIGDAELPDGALIDRTESGDVAGTIREHAIGHMRQFIPAVPQEEWESDSPLFLPVRWHSLMLSILLLFKR